MITFLSILVALIALGLIVVPKTILKSLVPESVANAKFKIGAPIFILAAIASQFNFLFFYAEPGYSYLVQYITGTQVAELTPGYHLKLYGQVIPMKKVLTVKASSKKNADASGQTPPVPIRFNDAVTAKVDLALRFRLPEDKETFKKLALDFRSQENLISGALIPTALEVTRNSGRMLSAQEYISGKGGEFENAVQEQLEQGIFILETREIPQDTTKESIQQDDRGLEHKRTIRYEVRKRVDGNGTPIRKKHTLTDYRILIAQATVEAVDPEPKFKEMLAQQRDAAAQANVEKQKAQKAEYEKQRIIASGEAEKATIRVEQEKEQIQTLIKAETEQKEQKILVEKEKLALEASRLEATRIQVMAEAEATKKRKIFQADGALKQKLDAYVEVQKAYAEAIKGAQLVPTTVMGGNSNGSNNASAFINLMTAKAAKDLQLDLGTK